MVLPSWNFWGDRHHRDSGESAAAGTVAGQTKAQTIICLDNARQLALGWLMYANEHDDRLTYNLGGATVSSNLNNWAAGILDRGLTPDNTNATLLTRAALGAYASKSAAIYH